MVGPLRVVVVDDSPVLREVLAAYLHQDPGLDVVRTFGDAESLVEAVADLRPDVVVMDNQMPGMDGVDALPKLRRLCPGLLAVVMWSSDTAAGPVALARGADRFVGKDEPLGAVVDAVVHAA